MNLIPAAIILSAYTSEIYRISLEYRKYSQGIFGGICESASWRWDLGVSPARARLDWSTANDIGTVESALGSPRTSVGVHSLTKVGMQPQGSGLRTCSVFLIV